MSEYEDPWMFYEEDEPSSTETNYIMYDEYDNDREELFINYLN